MNESISMLKLTIIAALGVIAAYFNALMIPIVVLVFVMVTDYISGMASAFQSTPSAGRATAKMHKFYLRFFYDLQIIT